MLKNPSSFSHKLCWIYRWVLYDYFNKDRYEPILLGTFYLLWRYFLNVFLIYYLVYGSSFPWGSPKFYESFRQKYFSLIRDALKRIERAIEMLNLKENEPSYTLDVGWGSGLSGEG